MAHHTPAEAGPTIHEGTATMHLLQRLRRRRLITPLSAARSSTMAHQAEPRPWCPWCLRTVFGPLAVHVERMHRHHHVPEYPSACTGCAQLGWQATRGCSCTYDAELGEGSACPCCGHRDHGRSGCAA